MPTFVMGFECQLILLLDLRFHQMRSKKLYTHILSRMHTRCANTNKYVYGVYRICIWYIILYHILFRRKFAACCWSTILTLPEAVRVIVDRLNVLTYIIHTVQLLPIAFFVCHFNSNGFGFQKFGFFRILYIYSYVCCGVSAAQNVYIEKNRC